MTFCLRTCRAIATHERVLNRPAAPPQYKDRQTRDLEPPVLWSRQFLLHGSSVAGAPDARPFPKVGRPRVQGPLRPPAPAVAGCPTGVGKTRVEVEEVVVVVVAAVVVVVVVVVVV